MPPRLLASQYLVNKWSSIQFHVSRSGVDVYLQELVLSVLSSSHLCTFAVHVVQDPGCPGIDDKQCLSIYIIS